MFRNDPSVKVATSEISQYFSKINNQQLSTVHLGNCHKIEGVGNRVGKTAENEDGHAKE